MTSAFFFLVFLCLSAFTWASSAQAHASADLFTTLTKDASKLFSGAAQELRFRSFATTFELHHADWRDAAAAFIANELEQGLDARIETTPFADLTAAMFQTQKLMPVKSPEHLSYAQEQLQARVRPSDASLPAAPASFDWVSQGAVTNVKDQGALGSCWTFSTIGSIEGQRYLKYKKLESLSTEQLLECDANTNTTSGWADCGMFGGWPPLAYEYLESVQEGVATDQAWPYCAGYNNKSQCYPCMAKGYSLSLCGNHRDLYCNATGTLGQGESGWCSGGNPGVVQVDSWYGVDSNETNIAEVLVDSGPLSILMNAQGLQFYKGGVYDPKRCDPSNLDHAVLLVGYGTDEDGQDYWKIKNSWGTKWGEDGYFRIVRGQAACGVNTFVTSSVVA